MSLSALARPARAVPLLAVLIVGVYLNSLDNGFHFDDDHSLVKNPAVRSVGNIPAFFVDPALFSRNPGSAMYRPLVLTTYALNYAVGGYHGKGYHVVNIGLHVLVTVLAYALLRDVFRDEPSAWVAALFVAVEPLATEPVNYVSSRSETLCAAGVLISLLLYRRTGGRLSWGSVLAFAAALLSKSSAITLPAVLLLHDHLLGSGAGPGHRGRRIPLWRRHWPYWAVGTVYLVGVSSLVQEATWQAPVRPLVAHWSTQIEALAYYARMLAFPHPLSVEHQFAVCTGPGEPALWLSGAFALSLGWAIGHDRRALFWGGWLLLALLPTLIVPLNVLVNERRLYLPVIAFAGSMVRLAETVPRTRAFKWAILVLLPLSALTLERNRAWGTPKELWSAARRVAPQAVRPCLRLGNVYRRSGNTARAKSLYLLALKLDPRSAAAHNNLGNLYASQGLLDSAVAEYQRALRIAPRYVEAQIDLAAVRSRQGDTQGAIALLEKARGLAGEREELLNNLGTAYLRAGRYADAEAVLRQAARRAPRRAGIRFNLGGALAEQGRYQEAVQAYRQALELDPGYVRAWYGLAAALRRQGDRTGAMNACRRFLAQWRGDPAIAAQVRGWLQELTEGVDP